MFGSGPKNCSSYFLNTLIEEELRIFISRLFHLDITTGKMQSLKKVMSGLKTRNFVALRTSLV